MELAKTLLKLWTLRLWIGIGAIVAILAAIASLTLMHSKVYATASTQMIVDAPATALGDSEEDLTPYTARAFVFARLMTAPQALQYIGQAAGLPGNLIAASGPTELTGPQATHAPTATAGVTLTAAPVHYSLNFLQNPALPTVDVYSQAPTTKQAIALANGAVSGFSAYIDNLDNQSAVPAGKRIVIRQLGAATGGIVDPGANKSIAAIIFVAVFAIWCLVALRLASLRSQLRLVRARRNPVDPALDSPSWVDGTLPDSYLGRSAPASGHVDNRDVPVPHSEVDEHGASNGLGDPEDAKRIMAWDRF